MLSKCSTGETIPGNAIPVSNVFLSLQKVKQPKDRMTYLEQIDKGKKQFDPVESQCPKTNSFCAQRRGVQFTIAIILKFALATMFLKSGIFEKQKHYYDG